MRTETSAWESALSMLLKPRLLLQGFVEYFSAWVFTRPWLRLMFFNSPIILLTLTAAGLVVYGSMLDNRTLVERYADWTNEELPQALGDRVSSDSSKADSSVDGGASAETVTPSGTATDNVGTVTTNNSGTDQPTGGTDAGQSATNRDSTRGLSNIGDVSAYGELLLRRLLQLQDSNSRITYLVALQLAAKGRAGQAQQMMRRVAPEDRSGFAPAHAWLAIDRLRTGEVRPDDVVLNRDLSEAAKWQDTNPDLLLIYANLLERQNKVSEAMSVLEQGGQRDSKLNIALAQLAARHDNKQRLERVSSAAKEEIRARMEDGSATVEDLIQLSSLFLLEDEPERALKVAEMGLEKDPVSEQLRRNVSEAYRSQYLKSVQLSGEGATVNLSLLDAALRSDPTNPGVSVEVARLITAGKEATPKLRAALEEQLANGLAPALTHILLALRALQDGKISQAVPHLKLADKQAPNNPMILNNLALALAMTTPEDIDEALKLSARAISYAPQDANYRDTLGEIRALNGDFLGAAESYESALELDNTRTETRSKLAAVYRKLGLDDMASVQEKRLKELQENRQE